MAGTLTGALAAIEDCRRECRRLVDDRCGALLRRLLLEEGYASEDSERVLTLAALPERFKGTKPVALILPGGAEVRTPAWKKAVAAILRDCDGDPGRHERMLELRGNVFGNFRPLLAETPEGMGAPLKIAEGLYWESKFDTEALLRNLTGKLLYPVGYDCQGVVIRFRDARQEAVQGGMTQMM